MICSVSIAEFFSVSRILGIFAHSILSMLPLHGYRELSATVSGFREYHFSRDIPLLLPTSRNSLCIPHPSTFLLSCRLTIRRPTW